MPLTTMNSQDAPINGSGLCRVLVVEDEEQVRHVIAAYLSHDGFTVEVAADGNDALRKFKRCRPDLVILDIMLPGKSGTELLTEIRADGNETPVIVLSALGAEPDRVAGLDLGADDYLAKPATPRELSARIRAVLRRTSNSVGQVYHFSGIVVDVSARSITRNGEPISTRPKEFDLLVELIAHAGQVLSRPKLLQSVWGSRPEWQDPGTVTVHIRRLRRLIEIDPGSPKHIVTVYGVGYRFDL